MMSVTETLHRVVLVIVMLTALTAGSALTRPRMAVLAAELPGSHAGAPDVAYPNCMTCRVQDRAGFEGGDVEMEKGRGRWSGNGTDAVQTQSRSGWGDGTPGNTN